MINRDAAQDHVGGRDRTTREKSPIECTAGKQVEGEARGVGRADRKATSQRSSTASSRGHT